MTAAEEEWLATREQRVHRVTPRRIVAPLKAHRTYPIDRRTTDASAATIASGAEERRAGFRRVPPPSAVLRTSSLVPPPSAGRPLLSRPSPWRCRRFEGSATTTPPSRVAVDARWHRSEPRAERRRRASARRDRARRAPRVMPRAPGCVLRLRCTPR